MHQKGFTLIELLIVITIIGILMAIVGTAGFGLLTDAEEQKTKAVFLAWVTQLHQYKETYKHFPPVLLQFEEGKAVELGREFEDNHDKFVASLKGKKWDRNSRNWLPLDNFRDQNKRQREFHSFTEDEVGEEPARDDGLEELGLGGAPGGGGGERPDEPEERDVRLPERVRDQHARPPRHRRERRGSSDLRGELVHVVAVVDPAS